MLFLFKELPVYYVSMRVTAFNHIILAKYEKELLELRQYMCKKPINQGPTNDSHVGFNKDKFMFICWLRAKKNLEKLINIKNSDISATADWHHCSPRGGIRVGKSKCAIKF